MSWHFTAPLWLCLCQPLIAAHGEKSPSWGDVPPKWPKSSQGRHSEMSSRAATACQGATASNPPRLLTGYSRQTSSASSLLEPGTPPAPGVHPDIGVTSSSSTPLVLGSQGAGAQQVMNAASEQLIQHINREAVSRCLLLTLLATPDTGVQALQQVRETFLGAGHGKGTLGCAGGKNFNLSFLPSKG